QRGLVGGGRIEQEPVEAVPGQRQEIGQLADPREAAAAEELERHPPAEAGEVELDRLRGAREIEDAEDRLLAVRAQVGQHLAVRRVEKAEIAAAEGKATLAHGDEALHPVEEGRGRAAL